MMGQILRSGRLEAYRAAGSDGSPVYLAAPQLLSLLRQRLGDEIANRFAIPRRSESGERVDWYAPVDAHSVVPWRTASVGERTVAKAVLLEAQAQIVQLAGDLVASENREHQRFGRHLIELGRFPSEDDIYLVDGKPVVTFWSFEAQDVTPGRARFIDLTPLEPTVPDATRDPQPRRPSWWWLLPLAALLVLIAVLFWWQRYGYSPERSGPVAVQPAPAEPIRSKTGTGAAAANRSSVDAGQLDGSPRAEPSGRLSQADRPPVATLDDPATEHHAGPAAVHARTESTLHSDAEHTQRLSSDAGPTTRERTAVVSERDRRIEVRVGNEGPVARTAQASDTHLRDNPEVDSHHHDAGFADRAPIRVEPSESQVTIRDGSASSAPPSTQGDAAIAGRPGAAVQPVPTTEPAGPYDLSGQTHDATQGLPGNAGLPRVADTVPTAIDTRRPDLPPAAGATAPADPTATDSAHLAASPPRPQPSGPAGRGTVAAQTGESHPNATPPAPATPTVDRPKTPGTGADAAQSAAMGTPQGVGPGTPVFPPRSAPANSPADRPSEGPGGAALRLPPGTRDVRVIDGSWQARAALRDNRGQPVQLGLQFDNGNGEIILNQAGMPPCRAPATATVDNDRLIIAPAGDITCRDINFGRPQLICRPGSSGMQADCSGVYDTGQTFDVSVTRAGPR